MFGRLSGEELKTIRLRLGMTQRELAEKIGVARNTVWRWEVGRASIGVPEAHLIRLLAARKT